MHATTIALSLTEDYAPSWGVWEGVRELVQNWHDGCLRNSGQVDSWTALGGDAFVAVANGKEVGVLSYDAAKEELQLVNRDVGLARRVLLLGSSHKADSSHAIGQFGEGMKVGCLALLREGRHVEMSTRDEHWHWTRRLDASFGVRVLTIEVTLIAADCRRLPPMAADGRRWLPMATDCSCLPSFASYLSFAFYI